MLSHTKKKRPCRTKPFTETSIYKTATCFLSEERSILKSKLHLQINLSSLQGLARFLLNEIRFEIMSSSNDAPQLTDSAWLKKAGWMSMKHFMLSYQLKMENDNDYEQGKIILAAIRAAERDEAASDAERSTGISNTPKQTQTNGAINHNGGKNLDALGNQDGKQHLASGSTGPSGTSLDDKRPVEFMGTLRVCFTNNS